MNPTDDLFWPYFEPMLRARRVAYVQMSDANGMDRLLADSRSEDVYPGIFVMRPKYRGRSVDAALLLADFQVIAYVLCAGDPSDRASEDAAFQQAETIATGLIQALKQDNYHYTNYLDFDSIQMEPVLYHTGADASYGYELKLKLGLPASSIYA